MNYYIELMKRLWEVDKVNAVDTYSAKLYAYLVDSCHELKWKHPFGHSVRHLAATLSMSINTVQKSKENLAALKLICYEPPMLKSRGTEGQTKFWFTVSPHDTVGKTTVLQHDTVIGGKVVSPHDTDNQKNAVTVSPNDTDGSETVSRHDTNSVFNNTDGLDIVEEAAASSSKKGSSKNAKRKESLYHSCIDIYNGFIENLTGGMGAKIDGAQGKAMNAIILYLKRQTTIKFQQQNNDQLPTEQQTHELVLGSWRLIFDNWHCLSKNYQQGKTKLTEINSDLQNILLAIKNGFNNKKSGDKSGAETRGGNTGGIRPRGGTVAGLQSLKRSGSADDHERTEFTATEEAE